MRRPISAARTLPECRPASWRCEACPSSSWIERRSAPPSSRCVANECRSACGEAPATPAAWRAHTRRRRRTSDVESRRPDFEMNSAGVASAVSSAGRPRSQVAVDRPQRGLAGRHEARLAALALHAHALAVEVDRVEVEVHELLGAQAGRVGQLEQRAVAQRERGVGGDAVEQRGDLGRLQHAREPLRRGAAPTAGRRGSAPASPCSTSVRNSARSEASLRATVLGACPASVRPAA